MKLLSALELENKRVDDVNTIYLHRDGKFYHVYERSAWLIKTVVCTDDFQKERGDKKILSVRKCSTKRNGSYAVLGFPIESIAKFIPKYVEVKEIDGGDLELKIENDTDYLDVTEAYECWKDGLENIEPKKQKKEIVSGKTNISELGHTGLFSIVSQILSYPIEESNFEDNFNFISKLKKEIAKLL